MIESVKGSLLFKASFRAFPVVPRPQDYDRLSGTRLEEICLLAAMPSIETDEASGLSFSKRGSRQGENEIVSYVLHRVHIHDLFTSIRSVLG